MVASTDSDKMFHDVPTLRGGDGGGFCTQSVQHRFKVHSVSVYFSAVRKIEKKRQNKEHSSCCGAGPCLTCGSEKSGWDRRIYKNHIKTVAARPHGSKNKALGDTSPQKQPHLQSKMEMIPVQLQWRLQGGGIILSIKDNRL